MEVNMSLNNNAFVIAHTSCDNSMPDFLVEEDNTIMRFKSKEHAKEFISKIAPMGFDYYNSQVTIMRMQ
jgi:hypothetical protein